MSCPEKSSITCIDRFTVPCTEKMGIFHTEKSTSLLVGREVSRQSAGSQLYPVQRSQMFL